jgi:hypothetical protein
MPFKIFGVQDWVAQISIKFKCQLKLNLLEMYNTVRDIS